jgi:tRNA(Leu) C34 or U34 (ribose-2'-O)-methylase TrmL
VSERGYFGIGIYQPQKDVNIGTLLRSAHCLGADFTYTIADNKHLYRQASNTTRSERHVPHYEYADWDQFLRSMPVVSTLVAVENSTGAVPLSSFPHPERAIYLLGREDQGLPSKCIAAAQHTVIIPSRYCLNVAAAGSIVLYDRCSKELSS